MQVGELFSWETIAANVWPLAGAEEGGADPILETALGWALQAQWGLQDALQAVGLGDSSHGQAGWPWSHRLAAETLLMDNGLVRQTVVSMLALVVMLLVLALAVWAWRRHPRLWFGSVAVVAALCWLTPWPPLRLLLVPAVPTSLQKSPTGFTATSIVRGQVLYREACARCHGADGRGEGPDAARGAMWPPNLNGALLWRRLEGELFWRVRHGWGQGADGALRMPAAPARWRDSDVWAVLDFLQAQAAGQTLREAGRWTYPVRLPDAQADCRWGSKRLRDLSGQRLRIDWRRESTAPDPRWVSLRPWQADTDRSASPSADCGVTAPEWSEALALLLGTEPPALGPLALLVDRQGWIRAVSRASTDDWSEDDLVCRANAPAIETTARSPKEGSGLDRLLARVDAEPVRPVRGGFPH